MLVIYNMVWARWSRGKIAPQNACQQSVRGRGAEKTYGGICKIATCLLYIAYNSFFSRQASILHRLRKNSEKTIYSEKIVRNQMKTIENHTVYRRKIEGKVSFYAVWAENSRILSVPHSDACRFIYELFRYFTGYIYKLQ